MRQRALRHPGAAGRPGLAELPGAPQEEHEADPHCVKLGRRVGVAGVRLVVNFVEQAERIVVNFVEQADANCVERPAQQRMDVLEQGPEAGPSENPETLDVAEQQPGWLDRHSERTSPRLYAAAPAVCLLYTSDAADE